MNALPDKISAFREVLLRKTNDEYLSALISAASEDYLINLIVESLKKAKPTANMGRSANAAITAYASSLTNADIQQLRDAIGHHIGHYKTALHGMYEASDSKQKEQMRSIADQHLNRVIPLMHLAARSVPHSNGKLSFDYISTTPWETNYSTPFRHSAEWWAKTGRDKAKDSALDSIGKLIEGTKDLGRRVHPRGLKTVLSQKKHPETNNDMYEPHHVGVVMRTFPNYRYLEMPPHPEHSKTAKLEHKGGYPFETIRLGSPSEIDSGKGYIHIHEVQPQSQFIPHPFDYHPVTAFLDPKKSLREEEIPVFAQKLQEWHSSPHHVAWLNSQKEQYAKDPEAYKARGTKPSPSVFPEKHIPHEHPDLPQHHKDAAAKRGMK